MAEAVNFFSLSITHDLSRGLWMNTLQKIVSTISDLTHDFLWRQYFNFMKSKTQGEKTFSITLPLFCN